MRGLDELTELRQKIDRCDRILTEAFAERMEIVREILRYKKENGLPVLAPAREAEVIRKVASYLKSPTFARETEELFTAILGISKRYQARILFPYNIVLIGFMGAGKTTVGKALAEMLAMDFFDTDAMIQTELGIPVAEVFASHGEAYFRQAERKTVGDLSRRENSVIAGGGGAVLDADNVGDLKEHGKLVWLQATAATILSRLSGDSSRPLLRGRMSPEGLDGLLRQREPYYRAAADIEVGTDGKTAAEICREISAKLLQMNLPE